MKAESLKRWQNWVILFLVVFTFVLAEQQAKAETSPNLLANTQSAFDYEATFRNPFFVDYLETFSTAGRGVPVNAICDFATLVCCTGSSATTCPGNNFAGVNWILYSLDGTSWNRGTSGTYWDNGDYFVTTGAGVLEGIDFDDTICWQSPVLVTSVTGTSAFTADISWLGFDSGADDEINVEYSLNGGSWVRHPNVLGASGTPGSTVKYSSGSGVNGSTTTNFASIAITSGNTMRVRVCFDNNANTEVVTLDNVSVTNFQPLAPTAADVNVSGRVLNASGRGIFGSIVTVTDANGVTRSVRTNPFGYYTIYNLQAGETYIFNISAKGYSFTSQVVSLDDEIRNLDFTADK